jgi:hypothetical protein
VIKLLNALIDWVGEKAIVALIAAILDGDKDKAARLATAAAAKAAIRRGPRR